MKSSYFNQAEADKDDFMLVAAKMQGYVPQRCLLGGIVAMSEINRGKSPCDGCNCPRDKCGGKPRQFPGGGSDDLATD